MRSTFSKKHRKKKNITNKYSFNLAKIDTNGVAMARYGLKLSQDGAIGHINLLET